MRIVLGSRHTLQIALSDQFTHQHGSSALDTLTAIIGEGHILFTETDTVTEDAEDGTRSHDIAIETFLLQGIVLCQTCLVDEVHGFLHRVLDVFVIRCKSKEIMVDFLYSY